MERINRQKGVGLLVVALGIVVVAVLIIVLVLVLGHGKKGGTGSQASQGKAAKPQAASAANPNQLVAGGSTWQVPPTTAVSLSNWNVHMALPASSVGNALFKYSTSSPGYVFSTKQIVTDPNCIFFYNNSISPPGLEMQRYTKDFAAQGVLPDVADNTTLDQYYTANKAADGNYFVELDNGGDPTVVQKRWYKVGAYFYTIEMPSLTTSYTKGVAQYCTQSPADYYTQFAQMLTTIQGGLK